MLLKIIYSDAVQPSLLLDRAATAQSIRDAQVWVREALARGIAAGESIPAPTWTWLAPRTACRTSTAC